ncbi:hypothetical protein P280DRAFT_510725 [Massarina eburnea CBS 473.64]|uniref:Nephrocystin 3-like N-terminal domain-containing protein n=1 Tax=Massarina eburnea CBS 473.64 TaxID=1395130 RepID=A0A6A6RM76_9PLEO|nr:hypothetical protein P280DRAFT_510725 [Massarina eburnea CBS 473.64]
MDSPTKQEWTHAALSVTHGLSSDIYRNLFENFFEHPVFVRWSGEFVDWVLYCVGDPGAGKTTLAALVTRRLRQRFECAGFPVIPIFVQEDVTQYDHEFLEDFMHLVYQSLGKWESFSEDQSNNVYREYIRVRFGTDEDCGVNRKLVLIREALYRRLKARGNDTRIFLIIDGMDLCSQTLLLLLEAELSQLRSAGVSMLRTSRIPGLVQEPSRCDHPKHTENEENEEDDEDGDDDAEPLGEFDRSVVQMFYSCENCLSILCLPCKAAERTCASGTCAKNGPMRELYDHVNYTLSIPDEDMEAYLAWSLEREHGNLKLNSSVTRMPPHSSLGLSIRKDKDPEIAKAIIDEIRGLSSGHIATAKARLELVHGARSIEEVFQNRYLLPANILSMFDAAINAIEHQDPMNRSLGLKAIAAVGRDPDGIEVTSLQKLLNQPDRTKVSSSEEILRATRGLLMASVHFGPPSFHMFSTTFDNYVFDRHGGNLRRIRRGGFQSIVHCS